MNTPKKSQETFEEIVFRNRNQKYGAYFLRKTYGRTVMISVIIAVSGFSCIVTFSRLAMKPSVGPEIPIVDTVRVIRYPQPLAPEPPQVPVTPATSRTIDPFRPPRVVDSIIVTNLSAQISGPVRKDTNLFAWNGQPATPERPTAPAPIAVEPADSIHLSVQEMPSFPGGEEELLRYLAHAVVYPEIARELGITGVVYIAFVIEKDGSITQVVVKRGIGGGCEDAAVRAVKMMPRWNPGRQQGMPVRVQFILPVKFTLRGL
jgi:protein TonB